MTNNQKTNLQSLSKLIKELKQKQGDPYAVNYNLLRQKQIYSYTEVLELFKIIGSGICRNFTIDEDNVFIYENLAKWLVADNTMQCHKIADNGRLVKVAGSLTKGILISGGTGRGKSVALDVLQASASTIRQAIKVNDKVVSLAWQNLHVTEITEHFKQHGTVKDYFTPTILAVQDIGSEQGDSLHMGNRSDVIGEIIQVRGDNVSKTLSLFTTNLPLKQENGLGELYNPRVLSRLNEMCNYFELRGKDRRL